MKNLSPIEIGKVAAALLANLKAYGFTPYLGYRDRSHRTNNEQIGLALGAMKATLALADLAPDAVDVSELRLRVLATGRRASKSEMNWQVDDLIGYLQARAQVVRLTQERGEEVSQEAITKREPSTEPKVEEWVYFREGGSCVIRRFSRSWPTTSYCEMSTENGWRRSSFTVGEAIEMVSLPQFFECDEDGDSLTKLGPRPVSVLTMFNGPAEPTPKPYAEATDPATGISYKIGGDGEVFSRRSNDVSWCAAPCTIAVIKAVTKLGLV